MTQHGDDAQLQEYALGALGAEESQRVLEHLEVCAVCARKYQGILTVERLLRSMPLEHADPRIAGRVLARIARAEHPALMAGRVRWGAVIGVAASVLGVFLALGVVGVMFWQQPAASGSSAYHLYVDRWVEGLTGFTRTGSSILMRVVPQIFGPGPLPISVTVVLLVPVFLLADRFLTRRRTAG